MSLALLLLSLALCLSLAAVSNFNRLHAKEMIFSRCNHCDSVFHTGAHPA